MVHALCCKEIFLLYGFSRETGEGYVERYVACTSYVVRKFSICKDFPKRQGRNTWKGICCMHCLVVRKFSICKDFPERQGMDTWRSMLHALCLFGW